MPASALIVGCGRIAGGFNDADETTVLTHAAAYRRLATPIVACCDRDPERAARFAERWSVPHHGPDLRDVLRRGQPELVSLCTPPSETNAALEIVLADSSVRAVLVEKPLGGSGQEARRLAQLAERDGRPLLVNYFRAFDPFHDRLLAETRSGNLGHLCDATARYYGSSAANASHWLERVLALFGEPRSVARLGGSSGSPRFEIGYARGQVTFLPSDGCEYSPFELDLHFERRRLRLVDSERRVEHHRSTADPRYAGYFTLVPDDPWPGCTPSSDTLLLSVGALLRAVSAGTVDWRGLLARAVAVNEILERVG